MPPADQDPDPQVPAAPADPEAGGTAPIADADAGADQAGEPGDSAEPSGTEPGPAAAGGGRARRRAWPAALGLATVILGSFGIWATVAAHSLHAAAAVANTALVDPAATRAVRRDITGAVNTIFSYSYASTERTRAAAQQLLTGNAIRQYNQLFALVQQQAPKEKLVVTTRVTDIGVELVTGGRVPRARLLVFANQQDTRAGTGQTSYGGAMFAVTAVSEHGRWLIENIATFTGQT